MNWSIEAALDSDDYKEYFAKRVFLFVLGKLQREKAWSYDECRNHAYDITMEGIASIMEQEEKGNKEQVRVSYANS